MSADPGTSPENPARVNPESLTEAVQGVGQEPPSVHPFNALTHRFPGENLTVLTHFYRGELGRAIAWRQKMDMTTHWAIITATALVSVVFTNPSSNHMILPFGSALIYLLLHIEGRRYRFYDVWRTRVRMLEVHFIVPSLAFEHRLPEGNWRETLCNDLFKPTYKISYWESVGRRLHRNYGWLFLLVLLSWLGKILMDAGNLWPDAFEVRQHLEGRDEVIPGWLVVSVAGAFHGFLLLVFFIGLKARRATGEIRRKNPDQKVWPI